MAFSFKFKVLFLAVPAVLLAAPAYGDDFKRDKPRERVYCFPAKYVTEMQSKFDDLDADKRDVVDIRMDPKFKIYDDGKLPDRFFLRDPDGEDDFTVTERGAVPDFLSLIAANKGQGDICIEDAARIGKPGDYEGLYFEMGLSPIFITAQRHPDGTRYDYPVLREGTKDGKSLYKTMVPAVARMFMPDTDYLSIAFDDAGAVPKVTAYTKSAAIGDIETTAYGDGHVFSRKVLKKMGADYIVVTGGAHKLSPVPSIKTMRRFGIGEKKLYTEAEE